MPPGIVSLTTDFGSDDWFVGTVKGVVLSRHPGVTLVDVSHGVAPGDIRGGAFTLLSSCRFFPQKTVHLAIVDPGVGSSRAAIAVQTERYHFVAPDNGVLSWILRSEKPVAIHHLDNPDFFLNEVSQTFHGRDIFAPAAAALAAQTPISSLGSPCESIVELAWPELTKEGPLLRGEVLFIDHFGNAITNFPNRDFGPETKKRILLPRTGPCQFVSCYAEGSSDEALGVPGSSGFMEIAINGGHAASTLGLETASPILVEVE